MSRSGYSDDGCDQWDLIRWRGAVASAIRGKRGQAFLREMLGAMDALPAKELVASELEMNGQVCALGSVGRARGIDLSKIDSEDADHIAHVLGINDKLAREIVYINDEAGWHNDTPETRFQRVRNWIITNLRSAAA